VFSLCFEWCKKLGKLIMNWSKQKNWQNVLCKNSFCKRSIYLFFSFKNWLLEPVQAWMLNRCKYSENFEPIQTGEWTGAWKNLLISLKWQNLSCSATWLVEVIHSVFLRILEPVQPMFEPVHEFFGFKLHWCNF
jgi:hypothetical protein